MDTQKSRKILKALSQINEISQKLDTCYQEMKDSIITTPTAILDSFDKFITPNEELECAIKLFENLVSLIENIADATGLLKEFAKDANKNIDRSLVLISSSNNITKNCNSLQRYQNTKQIKKYLILGEQTKNSIYTEIENFFFRIIRTQFLKKIDNLEILSNFLTKNGDKVQIAEIYIQICVKKLSYKQYIEDKELFLEKCNNSSQDFEELKSMNSFLFEEKLAIFLNESLIKIIDDNLKTCILSFLQFIDTQKNFEDILYILRLYKISKESILVEYFNVFLKRFFDYLENLNVMEENYGSENFIFFSQKLFNFLTEKIIEEFLNNFNDSMKVENRKEFENKILLTIYTKIKHLCINKDKFIQNIYLIANMFELSQIKNEIYEINLFDEIKKCKKEMIKNLKDQAAEIKNDSTIFVNQIVEKISKWKSNKEIKSGIVDSVEKILKETVKNKPYKGNFEEQLGKLNVK